jgi:6-phosphogluconate dehydrogenase
MQHGLGMSAPDMAKVFAEWNQGELNSYLIEIAAAALGTTDAESGKPVVDLILDRAGQKGTGKWTSQNALDLGVAIPTINAALEARILSALKDQRASAAKVLHGPARRKFRGDSKAFLETLRQALRLAIVTCYAQGFALLAEASTEYGYHLHLPEIARIWKGGCIIRARLLDAIKKALVAQPALVNLLVAEPFSGIANEQEGSLRAIVSKAAAAGIPCLALAASLGYLDSYRRQRLPANLLQGLRDYFGAHRYERVDRPRGEMFHTEWPE